MEARFRNILLATSVSNPIFFLSKKLREKFRNDGFVFLNYLSPAFDFRRLNPFFET
tara:strand:- start:24962 stop:25129 length:168 start_codon:yes stop_codon:yes gene_type:complete